MCGIFGYIGSGRSAAEAIRDGLQRLDYRGYDSWGIAVLDRDQILVEKHAGVVPAQAPTFPICGVGIGHTRWATHGAVTDVNAHPHSAADGSFVLAHNGIVENAGDLKAQLVAKGHRFYSETDTESIVRLVEEEAKKGGSIAWSLRRAFLQLDGRNTVIVMTAGGDVVAARNGSPLVIGESKEGELYISSDVFSFAPHVARVLVLENGEMIRIDNGVLTLEHIKSGKKVPLRYEKNTIPHATTDKGGYPHYMAKEIREAPMVIRKVVAQPDLPYRTLAAVIKKARTVYCIGSGTAGAAAAQVAFYLRVYGKISAVSLVGAEAMDYEGLIGKKDLFIAVSQSGETADVLEVLEMAKRKGAKIASFVNMPGSMMTRMSDYRAMAEAGSELCVMSTKIFVSQIAWGFRLAKTVGGKSSAAKRELAHAARQIEKYLTDEQADAAIRALARELAAKQHVFLLGKAQNLQIIKEGMVKIIEGSYRHAHGIPAGDLKHYAITLMEPGVEVIALISEDNVKTDVLNAIHEVRARGARVTALAPHEISEADQTLIVPDAKDASAMMNVIPLQLLAYEMALSLGNNVDKPRNIAKSVTVK